MAKLSNLVATLSRVLNRPEPTVSLIARHLREAGMLSSGGRGPGGADMTASDCVSLLLGVVCAEQANTAPVAVARWRTTTMNQAIVRLAYESSESEGVVTQTARDDCPAEWLFLKAPGKTLGAALECLIEGFANGGLLDSVIASTRKAYGFENLDLNDDEERALAAINTGRFGPRIKFLSAFYQTDIVIADAMAEEPAIVSKFMVSADEMDSAASEVGDLVTAREISVRTILALADLIRVKT